MYSFLVILAVVLVSANSQRLPTDQNMPLPDVEMALNAILGVGVRLQVLLDEPDNLNKNFVASPYSLTLTLGQLLLGADSKFAEQLYNLLSLPETEDKTMKTIGYTNSDQAKVDYVVRYSKLHLQLRNLLALLLRETAAGDYNLTTSNALFYGSTIRLKDQFVHNLDIYLTEKYSVNFTEQQDAMRIINGWVSKRTNNLITNVLEAPLPPRTAAIFSSALYFKADWQIPFDSEFNTFFDFYPDAFSSVQVEYMRGYLEGVKYLNSRKLGCNMIALPYKGDELAFYILLPHANADKSHFNIRSFVDNMKANDLQEEINQMRLSVVTVQIPKINLKKSISLLKPLQKYKTYKDAESTNGGNARLSTYDSLDAMRDKLDRFSTFRTNRSESIVLTEASTPELIVNDIVQDLTFTVNEKGTEAAAVTTAILVNKDVSKSFKADRPFAFFVRHKALNLVLFWGTIVNPAQN